MTIRSLTLALSLAAHVAGQTAAQAQVAANAAAPRLVPMPRDAQVQAPVALRTPAVVVAGSDAADREAAAIFVGQLTERKVPASVSDAAAGWRVELLRTGTAAAGSALAASGYAFDAAMQDEGYVLIVNVDGARIVGATSAGVFYGLQTLVQLIGTSASGPTVRPAVIRDWPAMRWRGVHDDLSRGPVPTLEYQKRQIRTAAAYKINVWSLYFESSLEYRSHPLIAVPGGSMSQDDVRELVAYADAYHVTVIPEQEAFGHLHHILKNELYSGLGETPHGHVLAPGDTGSLPLIRDMLKEIVELFPAPFVHIGADETFDLGRGRSKPLADRIGIGSVYLRFMRQIEATLAPMTDKRLLFWHDVMLAHRELIPEIPKRMIAVAWNYDARDNLDRFLKPFRDAGLETWGAPGVSSWNRVWPNFGTALPNIRGFARDAQAGNSTGLLNTVWDDDGDAIFEQTWYAVLFGAAASWQNGESDVARFQDAFGAVFHGDTTGSLDAAHRSLIAAHGALQRSRVGDAATSLFFIDPWSSEGANVLIRLLPVLREVRLRAESALVFVAKAKRQANLRESSAIDAIELGARRIDWLAAKFQFADAIALAFARAEADTARAWDHLRQLSNMNGILQDMRDGFSLTRDLFEKAWRAENRPYWMTNALARFDAEIVRWVDRSATMDMLNRRWSNSRVRPRAEELGIPLALTKRPPS